jgi:hypothetical protein
MSRLDASFLAPATVATTPAAPRPPGGERAPKSPRSEGAGSSPEPELDGGASRLSTIERRLKDRPNPFYIVWIHPLHALLDRRLYSGLSKISLKRIPGDHVGKTNRTATTREGLRTWQVRKSRICSAGLHRGHANVALIGNIGLDTIYRETDQTPRGRAR